MTPRLLPDRWLQTYSRGVFDPFDPTPEMICIDDIAQGLALTCRFGGQCPAFYSVAQHSLLVSSHSPHPLEGLMHDAAEAYMTDMPAPIKHSLASLRAVERRIMRAIVKRFDLSEEALKLCKAADERVLATEVRDIIGGQVAPWGLREPPIPVNEIEGGRLEPMSWEVAKMLFLMRFDSLTGGQA